MIRALQSPARWAGLVLVVGSLLEPVSGSDNWPAFQNGGTVSVDVAADTPGRLGDVEWSRELTGKGQSSPVVWDGTVYVTSVSGSKLENCHVAAYRLTDGERLWQFDAPNPSPVEDSGYVSKAAPTPAADANGLIAFFEGGLVVALSPDGQVRWQHNLVEEHGPIASRHGLSASIEQSDELAFVWVERDTDPYVLAMDKRSGEARWKQPGLGVTSWASPRLVPAGDGQHLVLSGSGQLVGLDPQTGQVLWTLQGLSGNTVPTPIPIGEGRLLVGATDGRGESNSGKNAETNGVVELTRGEDGNWSANYLWRSQKAMSSFGSPIAHRGHVYIVNRSGIVTCLNAEDGSERYSERLPGSVWATPFGWGGSVVLGCKDGAGIMLAAGPRFQTLSELADLAGTQPVDAAAGSDKDTTIYGLAASGRRLIIRAGSQLTARSLE